MRNVCLEWDTRVQLCLLGQAEIEIKTEQTTIPWKLDLEGEVSFEIDFHQNAPSHDWQLHLRIYFYKNTQVIPHLSKKKGLTKVG